MSSTQPLGNKKVVTGADIAGRSLDVHMYGIDPQFFGTMKIPLLRGRNLRAGDTRGIVISKSFALQWATGDPLGRPFQMGDVSYTVVGVSGSARLVADPDAVEVYYLAPDAELPSMVMLVRASGPPEGLAPFVASIARSVDPNILPEVQLLKSSFQRKMEGAEYAAVTVGALGAVALLLASIGIVGLVAYAVSQRAKEIGIRRALGARSTDVLGAVLAQLLRPVSAGLAVGVVAAAVLSELLRRELYGISNLDPVAYVAAVGVLALTVIVAGLLPATLALRVDPMLSLRCE